MRIDPATMSDLDRYHVCAAITKRARKAAKRERDAERTREGRELGAVISRTLDGDALRWMPGARVSRLGLWDHVSSAVEAWGRSWLPEPRWRQRAAYRRSLPMALPWFCTAATQVRRALRKVPSVIGFGSVSIWVRGQFVETGVESDEFVPRGRTRPRWVWPWAGVPRRVERPPLIDVRYDGMVF